jgi:hypothetical protein
MSNGPDKPEDEGTTAPAGGASTTPTSEPAEAGPARRTAGEAADRSTAEPSADGPAAVGVPAAGARADAPVDDAGQADSPSSVAGPPAAEPAAEPTAAEPAAEPNTAEPTAEIPAGSTTGAARSGAEERVTGAAEAPAASADHTVDHGNPQEYPGASGQQPPAYGQPSGYWQPGSWQPGYAQPGYGQTGYAQQGYPSSGYAPPGYAPPGYAQPGYVPPGYAPPPWPGQPGYGPPGPGPQPYAPSWYGPPQAPRPGIVPLRPLAAGDVLAGAWGFIKENPALTIGVSAAVVFIGQLLQMFIEFALPGIDPEELARGRTEGLVGSVLGVAGSGVVSIVVSAALSGLLLVAFGQAVLGRRIGFGEAWKVIAPRVPGLVGLTLLVASVFVVIMLFPMAGLLAAATGSAGAILLGGLLVPVAIVAIVYLAVLWAFANAVYVLEPVGVIDALKRSAGLVHGAWWRIFGVLLLAGLIVGVAAAVVMGVFGAFVAEPEGVAEMARVAIASTLVGTFATPFGVGVSGLLYVDQRIRRERFDLELARYPAAPR